MTDETLPIAMPLIASRVGMPDAAERVEEIRLQLLTLMGLLMKSGSGDAIAAYADQVPYKPNSPTPPFPDPPPPP